MVLAIYFPSKMDSLGNQSACFRLWNGTH